MPEIFGDLQRFRPAEQFGTANRAERLAKYPRLVHAGKVALAQANTDIDVIAVEVPCQHRGVESQIDIGVTIGKIGQALQ